MSRKYCRKRDPEIHRSRACEPADAWSCRRQGCCLARGPRSHRPRAATPRSLGQCTGRRLRRRGCETCVGHASAASAERRDRVLEARKHTALRSSERAFELSRRWLRDSGCTAHLQHVITTMCLRASKRCAHRARAQHGTTTSPRADNVQPVGCTSMYNHLGCRLLYGGVCMWCNHLGCTLVSGRVCMTSSLHSCVSGVWLWAAVN